MSRSMGRLQNTGSSLLLGDTVAHVSDSGRDSYSVVRKHWDKVSPHYHKAAPPGKPSEESVQIYRSHVEATPSRGMAVVLGCTPSLRTLAAHNFRKLVVIDFSAAMFAESKKLVDASVWAREERHVAPWSSITRICKNESVDMVLADSIFGQLDPLEIPQLLSRLERCLTRKGTFVGRVRIQNEEWRIRTLQDIMGQYVADLVALPESAGTAFMYRLYDHFADETGRVYTHGHWLALHIALQSFSPPEQASLVSILRRLHPYPCVWSQLRGDVFEQFARRTFASVTAKYAGDFPDAESFPVYSLGKR